MKLPLVLGAGAVGLAALAAVMRPHAPAVPLQASTAAPRIQQTRRVASRVVVYVTGEVNRPGVYAVEAGSRVEQALRAASGTTSKADLLAINLAEPLSDGEKLLVPEKGAVASDALTHDPVVDAGVPLRPRHRGRKTSSSATRHSHGRRSHKAPPAAPIDLNAADAAQLEELPGIGPSLAERIVAFRTVNGPFHTTDELLDVAGMTDRRLETISAYVVVRP